MTNKKNLTNIDDLIRKSKNCIKNNNLELASKLLEENQIKFPNEPQLLNQLAQISLIKNKLDDGISLLKKSIKVKHDQPLILYDLGIALTLNNKLEESIIFFDRAIEIERNNPKFYLRKAFSLIKLDRINESIDCYQNVIELNPKNFKPYVEKAELLESIGNKAEAYSLYKKAILMEPKNASLYIKYGYFLYRIDRFEEALIAYKASIQLEPINPGAMKNMGYLYKKIRKFEKAIFYLKESVQIDDNHEVNHNIGSMYCDLGNYIEGIQFYDRAIKIKPDIAVYFISKAYALESLNQIDKAILSYDKALKINNEYQYAYSERFNIKNSICDWSNFESEANWIKSKIKEGKKISVPLVLSALIDDPLAQKKAAMIYADDLYPLNNVLGEIRKYPKNEKIKIGYFSGDFTEHPVAFLVAELFEMHDKSKFELFAFSTSNKIQSRIRERIENSFDEFIDVAQMEDKGIANLARKKRIDIAIDLGGFTKNSRVSIFAMRAAPIQINFLGYPATTGSSYIDYNIADSFIIPNKLQKYYSEKIIYLPKCYQPNESKVIPGRKLFSRSSEGLPNSGFIFCCFNNSWKITPGIFKLWIQLLFSVEGSVLWFPELSPSANKNLKKECLKLGMNQDRLIFAARELQRDDHKEKIKLADVFLDCFPYGAQSTASDFLRAGVPIVTLSGHSFSNRVALSLLSNLNLPELVTSSELDYKNLAIKLANNKEYFKKIKTKLIKNVKKSSIYNVCEYTKSIESGYLKAYDRYHNNLDPDHIKAS